MLVIAHTLNLLKMFYDTIFETIIDFKFEVDKDDIDRFIQTMSVKDLPNEFVFQTNEGVFKVNRNKKEFRILERHYYPKGVGFPSDEQVEYTLMAMYKIASWSGFKVFLDPKYSN